MQLLYARRALLSNVVDSVLFFVFVVMLCSKLLYWQLMFLLLHGALSMSQQDRDFCGFKDWTHNRPHGDVIVSESEPSNPDMMPYVGNGYLATTIGSDTVYVSGVYNGEASIGMHHC